MLCRTSATSPAAIVSNARLSSIRSTSLVPPVLLIHGYLGTRGSMYILERRLNDDGLCVFSFNLGSLNVRDIRTSAFLIHRKIESILAQTSVKKIDIVGHSMGGLIGLYYAKKLGGHERVRKLVMMGTPQRGTWSALLGVATMGLDLVERLAASTGQPLPQGAGSWLFTRKRTVLHHCGRTRLALSGRLHSPRRSRVADGSAWALVARHERGSLSPRPLRSEEVRFSA